jgi:hypothetical protein
MDLLRVLQPEGACILGFRLCERSGSLPHYPKRQGSRRTSSGRQFAQLPGWDQLPWLGLSACLLVAWQHAEVVNVAYLLPKGGGRAIPLVPAVKLSVSMVDPGYG